MVPLAATQVEVDQLQRLSEQHGERLELISDEMLQSISRRSLIKDCQALLHQLVESDCPELEDADNLQKESMSEVFDWISAAHKSKVKRMILTGSLVQVYGDFTKKVFNEEDKANPNLVGRIGRIYIYTETIALELQEDFSEKLDLTILNLGQLIGPPLACKEEISSVKLIKKIIEGDLPSLHKIQFPMIDVRDAALIHVLLLENAQSFNKRINVFQGIYWLKEMAQVMSDEFSQYNYKISESELGSFTISMLLFFDKSVRNELRGYGKKLNISKELLEDLIDIDFRQLDESLIDMIYQLRSKGMIMEPSKEAISFDKIISLNSSVASINSQNILADHSIFSKPLNAAKLIREDSQEYDTEEQNTHTGPPEKKHSPFREESSREEEDIVRTSTIL